MHILAITPGRGFDSASWSAILHSGLDGFLIREPDLEAGELLRAARWCQQLAPDVELWVRGRLDVALACGAGLHAPERHPEIPADLAPLSRPLHDPAQFESRRQARQLLISPVFRVPGKGPAWGIAGLHGFLDPLGGDLPRLLALGGVDPRSAREIRHPRLAGIAVIRALWDAPVPARAVDALRQAWA